MIAIIFSFLVGMILEVLPLPNWAVWARPEWVFIILLFWVVSAPDRVGIITAFIVGIVMDLLTGTLLGQHAFVFTLVTYFIIKFHPQIKNFPFWQQVGMIFILTLLELALQYWIIQLLGAPPDSWGYWLPSITSAFIWPWFFVLLNRESMVSKIF